MATASSSVHVTTLPHLDIKDLCNNIHSLFGDSSSEKTSTTITTALVFMYGSWNQHASSKAGQIETNLEVLLKSALSSAASSSSSSTSSSHHEGVVGSILVDESDETLNCCVGDNGHHTNGNNLPPCPPGELPVLALSVQTPSQSHAQIQYLTKIRPIDLLHNLPKSMRESDGWKDEWSHIILEQFYQLQTMDPEKPISTSKKIDKRKPIQSISKGPALRIFIAGDRSSVGKSSVCLGLLGTLIEYFGYEPNQLAYIKPATQCEATQLVQKYCDKIGIECRPIGPLVYYKGFTRAFLAGETGETSESLLQQCGNAVDQIAYAKQIVFVDGVGFPAVGSICGTDNASVAKACGYPMSDNSNDNNNSQQQPRYPMGVVLVGGSGVGAAVDSFNLNATYFEQANVPVLGGIFNKLSLEGFYSLENCRSQVRRYFTQSSKQQQLRRQAFGFIPEFSALATSDNPMDHLKDFFQIFHRHVQVQELLDSAKYIQQHPTITAATSTITPPTQSQHSPAPTTMTAPPPKKQKISCEIRKPRTRQEIEQQAKRAGAAPSA